MPDANLNAWWGRHLAEGLDRAGCRHVVLCPGSRNSPLLFALATVFAGRLTTHWDERGAAFFALGMAKAERAPVAVCVTSGTAAANLLPAVCEADAAGVPLVLLTADRPPELHGCGAPQTMTQTGLFGVFADEVVIGEAAAEDAALQRLRTGIAAVANARRPVHLNVPLRDPLPPIPDGWTCPPVAELLPGAPRRWHHPWLPISPRPPASRSWPTPAAACVGWTCRISPPALTRSTPVRRASPTSSSASDPRR